MDNGLSAELKAYLEYQKPIYHTTINHGIKRLKRELRELHPGQNMNKLIKAYKRRAWSEYAGIARHRGSFPTHPKYETSNVSITTENNEETIKVHHGTDKK